MDNKCDTKKIAVIIPARGGSKGIPLKNIFPLAGKPLLSYSIKAALESKISDYVFVSTDCDKIAKVALKYKAKVINRPEEFAQDRSSTESVLIHALDYLKEREGFEPEYILTLPPTSPLRLPKTIYDFVKAYLQVSDKYDAMLSLNEDRSDFWQQNEQGEFARLFPNAPRRRQERKPLFLENSALYITKTKALIETKSILGKSCTGFVINAIESVDINIPLDLKWAEFLIKNKVKS